MKKYLEKYPWLRTQNLYTGEVEDDYCALNDMPEGWFLAFGDMLCEEMDRVLRNLGVIDTFYISQIKEKFGSLRCYTSVMNEEIRNVLRKYEALSSHICVHCGKPDVHAIDIGWFGPMCEDCYKTQTHICDEYDYSDVIEQDEAHMMPDDIHGTAAKIRELWKERQRNNSLKGSADE